MNPIGMDQWLQQATAGDFVDRSPVEAAVAANMISKCYPGSNKVTDDFLLEVCSCLGRIDPHGVDVSAVTYPTPSTTDNNSSPACSGLDACSVKISFELNDGMNICVSEAHPCSLGEGVEFIADLQSVADEFEQKFGVKNMALIEAAKTAQADVAAARAAAQQAERNAHLAVQQYQQLQREFEHYRASKTISEDVSPHTKGREGKSNPFKSAKDQFTQEVVFLSLFYLYLFSLNYPYVSAVDLDSFLWLSY